MEMQIDNIQSRIKQIPKFFNEKIKTFLQNIGETMGIFAGGEGVNMDKIEKIIEKYPRVNLLWLLSGEGVPVMPSEKEVATELKDCQTEKAALKKEISRLKRDRREATQKANAYTKKPDLPSATHQNKRHNT